MAPPATLSSEAATLARTHRTAQLTKAAATAALIRYYFRNRVNVRDPATVLAWLDWSMPFMLRGNTQSAGLAAIYGNLMRSLEIPNVKDGFQYAKATLTPEGAMRTSLAVVGPTNLVKKFDKIRALDIDPAVARALQAEAVEEATKAVEGAAIRHILDGGRDTLHEGVKRDPKAMGYIRTTKANPCYFCAMLASRGVVTGAHRNVYTHDSFEVSDARFIGDGDVKVHDHCGCSLKPVYTEQDPLLADVQAFTDLWDSMEHRGGAADIKQFRQLYEGRKVTAA